MGFAKGLGATALALALFACGGDDSGPPRTGDGGNGGGGGGTPTPSPTPTPVSYTKFADLTGTQTFSTTCAGQQFDGGSSFLVGGTPFGEGATIVSDRSGPSYDITSDGTGLPPFSVSFTQADRDTSRSFESYNRVSANNFTERFVTFPPAVNSVELEYTRFGQVIAETSGGFVNLFCAYGVPTELSDVPATTKSYSQSRFYGTVTIIENAGSGPASSYSISSSTATASANPTTGEVRITMDLKGRLNTPSGPSTVVTDLGTFTGVDTIDGTVQRFGGTLVDQRNFVSGTFGGWFFGPQGGTLASSFTINSRRDDDSDLVVSAVVFLR